MNFKMDTSLYEAFSKIDNNTIYIKSCYMGLCSDIDRYFRSVYEIDLFKYVAKDDFYNAYYDFPNLADLTIEQFNSFINIYVSIRNISAHLFLNYPIYIDDDLLAHFNKVCKPLYPITTNNKMITLFGAYYILALLSTKEPIWEFCNHFFRNSLFPEINRGEKMSNFQMRIEHWTHDKVCGSGKNIKLLGVNPITYKILNDAYKNTMVKIFFDFEFSLKKNKKASTNVPSLRSLLESHPYVSRYPELIDEISDLRNTWFHGYFLFDTQIINGKKVYLDINYFLKLLYKIKDEIAFLPIFDSVQKDIENFGKTILYNYFLRLVELTYKIIDRRLISSEKAISRVKTINSNVEKVNSIDTSIYDNALLLIGSKNCIFSVSQYKFTDCLPRNVIKTKLVIYQFISNDTIKLDEYDTKSNKLYLLKPNLEKEYQCKINGKHLEDYKVVEKITECNSYVIYRVE